MPQLLGNYGLATAAIEVATEVKEIDVLFVPNQPVPTKILGLLAELAQTTCLFEVYRNSVSVEEILSCVSKLLDFQRKKLKEERKNQQSTSTSSAHLWIFTPTLSQKILDSFGAQASKQTGVYLFHPSFRTGIVIIHQLPSTPETLWLRILGKGQVQQKALDELESLPPENPYKEIVLELVYKLLTILEVNRRSGEVIQQEDIELMMRIETLYLEKLKQVAQQAAQQATQQGEVNLTLKLLKRQLGDLPAELEKAVGNLALASVETLAFDLHEFRSIENLIDWLNTHDSGQV